MRIKIKEKHVYYNWSNLNTYSTVYNPKMLHHTADAITNINSS